MAQGPLTETIQPNKVDAWTAMTVMSPTAYKYPFLSMLKRSKKPVGLEQSWPVMDIEQQGFRGRAEGLDISNDDYQYQGRDRLKSVAQKFVASYKLTTEAEVTETHGVKDELTFQKAKALERLKSAINMALLSDLDCARENGTTTKNTLRGAFRWMEPSAASLNSEYPIGDAYRVGTACSYESTLAALTPEGFRDMLLAAGIQREDDLVLDMYCGLRLKTHMSGWGEHDPDATSTYVPLKRYMTNASDKAYLAQIDFFQFDAARVRAHVVHRLLCDADTGAKTDYSDRSGLVLNMDSLSVAFNLDIRHKPLPNLGGGERGFYEAILMLICGMPAGNLRFKISA